MNTVSGGTYTCFLGLGSVIPEALFLSYHMLRCLESYMLTIAPMQDLEWNNKLSTPVTSYLEQPCEPIAGA